MLDDGDKLVIEKASTEDLSSIALIHERALEVGVLSNCGTGYLIRMYASIMNSTANRIFVAKYSGKVVGFIVGTEEEVSPFRSFNLVALLTFLFNCIRKPYLISATLTVLRKTNRDSLRFGALEISHFAIDDEFRKLGLGSKLISLVQSRARSRGLRSVITTTHNERLADFYKSRFNAKEVSRLSTSKIDYITLKWDVDGSRR